ncbi:hypothetical protein LBMAG53_38030 [Planctomycetota bacterium]|nr:hypothetical protein LBMAG53_38030 [Planctomycetota bacterium]
MHRSRLLPTLALAVMTALWSSAWAGEPTRGDQPISVRDPGSKAELVRYGRSRALVIGCSRYQHLPALKGVANDLPLVQAALERHGFVVTPLLDPTGETLEKTVKTFIGREGAVADARLVIYYAGHGTTLPDGDEQQGYLCPVDVPSPAEDLAGFREKAVYLPDFINRAQQAASRHVLMAFDSCFSGSLFAGRAVPSAYVLRMAQDPVRLFITSGSAQEQVPDASVFRRAFIEGIDGAADRDGDGYVLGNELFSYVQKRVIDAGDARNQRQTPQYRPMPKGGQSVGDLVFVVPAPVVAVSQPPRTVAPVERPQPTAAPTGEPAPTGKPAPSGKAAIYAAAEQLERTGDATVEQRIAAWEAVLAAVPADELQRNRRDEQAKEQADQILANLKPQRERLERRRVLDEAERLDADPDVTKGQRLAAWQRVVALWQGDGVTLTPSEQGQLAGIESKAAKAGLSGFGKPAWASASGKDQYGTWADLTVDGVVQRMRLIKAGAFTMGSPASEANRDADETQHQVTLTKDFWLGDSEVTQGLWQAVLGNNPSIFKGADLPVEQVSWDDCQGFFGKLNGQVRSGGFRFPTEAEWEYGCRAGTTGAYAGDLGGLAWYSDNAGGTTHAVKTKGANAWGLFDMHGNVWEWCGDWKDDYPAGAARDPAGPASGSNRVDRGGSWGSLARNGRAANRGRDEPGNRDSILGFRLSAPVQAGP